jgi:hypothetical protein
MAERIPPQEYQEPVPEAVRPIDRVSGGPTIDRVRWGPILAGMVATLATILLLNVLGLAVGLSSLGPGGSLTSLATGAGIWSAITALIAFFVGGWMAGRTAAPTSMVDNSFPGLLNGAMVWAATLVLLLLLVAIGAGGALGLFGASFSSITSAISQGTAVSSAWGIFIALILTLAAALLGGWLGYSRQPGRELTH